MLLETHWNCLKILKASTEFYSANHKSLGCWDTSGQGQSVKDMNPYNRSIVTLGSFFPLPIQLEVASPVSLS